ncbi:hypothetical protein MHBO_000618, partial [Bonamia ostreae]
IDFYVTGHSLGGALAQIFALDLILRKEHESKVYTFGSPKVGNAFFSKLYDEVLPSTFRLVFKKDAISNLPMMSGYVHSGVTVQLDHAGNIIIDPSLAEKFIVGSTTSLDNHFLGNYINALFEAEKFYSELYQREKMGVKSSSSLFKENSHI